MLRARIDYHESPDRITFAYRLPGRLVAPVVLVWCGVGGLAVGVGLALALLVADIISDPGRDPTAFRLALGLGTAAGALALYLLYARAVWMQRVRVAFDYARNAVEARDLVNRRVTVPFADALSFGLAERTAGRQDGCALVLDTAGTGPVALFVVPLDCYAETNQLSNLVGRLNANLSAIHAVPDSDLAPVSDELAQLSREVDGLSRITGSYELPPDFYDRHHQPPE
jgi:hypothetical protein